MLLEGEAAEESTLVMMEVGKRLEVVMRLEENIKSEK